MPIKQFKQYNSVIYFQFAWCWLASSPNCSIIVNVYQAVHSSVKSCQNCVAIYWRFYHSSSIMWRRSRNILTLLISPLVVGNPTVLHFLENKTMGVHMYVYGLYTVTYIYKLIINPLPRLGNCNTKSLWKATSFLVSRRLFSEYVVDKCTHKKLIRDLKFFHWKLAVWFDKLIFQQTCTCRFIVNS